MYVHGDHGPFPLLMGAIMAVVMLIATIWRSIAMKKRTSDLQALAPQLGFNSFKPERNSGFAAAWGFLGQLQHGEDRYALNLFEGTYQDEKLYAFDYHYVVGSGKNRQVCYFTMFMLVIKQTFPRMNITPESLFMKIEGVFYSENIKFESAEFSRAYFVHSEDRKFAYDVCNPKMIDFLLDHRDLNIEIQGPVIALVFKPECPVNQYQANLQRLVQIRKLLPEYIFTKA